MTLLRGSRAPVERQRRARNEPRPASETVERTEPTGIEPVTCCCTAVGSLWHHGAGFHSASIELEFAQKRSCKQSRKHQDAGLLREPSSGLEPETPSLPWPPFRGEFLGGIPHEYWVFGTFVSSPLLPSKWSQIATVNRRYWHDCQLKIAAHREDDLPPLGQNEHTFRDCRLESKTGAARGTRDARKSSSEAIVQGSASQEARFASQGSGQRLLADLRDTCLRDAGGVATPQDLVELTRLWVEA
jgi:hypothetical protein